MSFSIRCPANLVDVVEMGLDKFMNNLDLLESAPKTRLTGVDMLSGGMEGVDKYLVNPGLAKANQDVTYRYQNNKRRYSRLDFINYGVLRNISG